MLNEYDLLKILHMDLVVRHKDGSICVIISFDITKYPSEMPVTFKRLATDEVFDGILPDIIGALMPVEFNS